MTNLTIPKDAIGSMMSTALNGDLNTAFAVLNQSGLTEAQKAKIAAILKDSRSDMEQRILEICGEVNIVTVSASSQATQVAPSEQGCVSFQDAPTSPFGNAYPCTFGFEGKHYLNATACFLAQQYTDQPEMFKDHFMTLDSEGATEFAQLNPMTEESQISWKNPQAELINRDAVLMKVLRAKFEQNPDLIKQLLETGTAYLVCQGHDLYLTDNFNGAGKNALGTSLMRLRGEFGGTGQVEPPAAYQSAMQSLQTRCHFMANELNSDIIALLFRSYFSKYDFATITAAACVNKLWNSSSTIFWAEVDLKRLCPKLTVLDAKAQGVNCDDEPKTDKLQLLKWVREISPNVEGSAGVTQLTMTKGTTLNQLIKIAKDAGMTVDVAGSRIFGEQGDVPVEQTYVILITNSVFMNSRNKAYKSQIILVEEQGCKIPTAQEYFALCLFTNKVFKKCLYGQEPRTFGRSSTFLGEEDESMCVGGTIPTRLNVESPLSGYCDVYIGAGGRRKV